MKFLRSIYRFFQPLAVTLSIGVILAGVRGLIIKSYLCGSVTQFQQFNHLILQIGNLSVADIKQYLEDVNLGSHVFNRHCASGHTADSINILGIWFGCVALYRAIKADILDIIASIYEPIDGPEHR